MDSVQHNARDELIFIGEISGELMSKRKGEEWIPYKLIFKRVLAYFSCELDTYDIVYNIIAVAALIIKNGN